MSLLLRERKAPGLTGLALSLAATLAGGASRPIESELEQRSTIDPGCFALNLLPASRAIRRPKAGSAS